MSSGDKRSRTEGSKNAVPSSTGAGGSSKGPVPRKTLEAIVQEVWDWDAIAMFHAPVSEETVPGYSTVIKKPTDLSTIRSKVRSGAFDNGADGFVEELQLMVSNALTFNGKGSVWHSHAKKLQKLMRGILQRHGVSGEADDDVYLPTRRAADSEATFAKEEQAADREDMRATMDAMNQDSKLSMDELLAKYRGAGAAAAAKAFEVRLGADGEGAGDDEASSSSSSSDDDDSDEEEEEFEDSGSSLEEGGN